MRCEIKKKSTATNWSNSCFYLVTQNKYSFVNERNNSLTFEINYINYELK